MCALPICCFNKGIQLRVMLVQSHSQNVGQSLVHFSSTLSFQAILEFKGSSSFMAQTLNSVEIWYLRQCQHVRCCFADVYSSSEGRRGREGNPCGKSDIEDLTFHCCCDVENIHDVFILMNQFNYSLELRFASLRLSNLEIQ